MAALAPTVSTRDSRIGSATPFVAYVGLAALAAVVVLTTEALIVSQKRVFGTQGRLYILREARSRPGVQPHHNHAS
jgi:hypothetical protein